MDQPCEQCIVSPMCKDPCENFVLFLDGTYSINDQILFFSPTYFAYLIRDKEVEVDFERVRWRWTESSNCYNGGMWYE